MKELSTEEKARAYDKALARAKEQLNGAKVFDYDNEQVAHDIRNTVYNTFPELRESGDERMWKLLKKYVHYNISDTVLEADYITREYLESWLEKQGEHAKFRDSIQVGDKVTRNRDGMLVNLSQLKRVAKPTDKVEPKFHVGDFIKHNVCNIICKVITVNSESYYIESIKTGCRIECFSAEQNFHLWTIEDARDGDVLVIESGRPFIFKGCLDERHPNSPVAYCGIDCGDDFHVSVDISWWTDGNVFPATKEQRDFLFQEMKDEGYEWDAEKKELKKIKQTAEIPFGAKDSELQEATYYIPDGYHAEINGNEVVIKKGKQKNTWKPTEKQINAIRLARSFVTDDFGNNPTLSEVLKELEEQLKKL